VSAQLVEQTPIIVIDDDETMRRACGAALGRAGYQVETFADGPSGLKRIEQVRPGLIVVDLKMPGMGGMEVIDHAKEIDRDMVVIVITGFATVSTAVEAMKAGAYDFIPKPFTAEELRVIIARGVERHRLALEAKRLRAEKEAQARKFVTFVSHQLQSPLGAVRQYLDVLLHLMGDDVPEQQRTWIRRSSNKINQMNAIIRDWLTLSKVEAGQLATQRCLVRWPELVAEVLEGHALATEAKQVTLHSEVPENLPPVIGDPPALKMLLSNLVSNGIEYNRAGGRVTIRAAVDTRTVSLLVSDTGVGIAPEHQDHVFEEFYRVVGEGAERTSGTGMGLPICRKIAEELDGEITLTSRPGQGSTFTVVLPRGPADTPAEEFPDDVPIGGA